MSQKEYPVVLITDNNYCIPTACAIQSVIDSYTKDGKLVICIITCNVSEQNKSLFKKFAQNNVQIRIIDYDTKDLERYNEDGYYVSGTALIKFCIPRLLSEYDKILYIDGDVLVQKDITEIYDIDIKGYYAAVVVDMAGEVYCNFHKRLALPRYFNSGVLLLNGSLFRSENLENRLFKTKKDHPEYLCMDQDVFNDVFDMRVKFLPQKWNCMIPNFFLMQEQLGLTIHDVDAFYGSTYKTIKNMEKDSYLIHLTNERKPWKFKNAYMSKKWLKTFKKTPFRRTKLHLIKANDNGLVGKRRFFIFSIKNYVDKADLTFLRIPIVRKRHFSQYTQIWFLGIPVAKRIWYEYEIVTVLFFFIRFRKPNWPNIQNKINSYISTIHNSSGDSSLHKAILGQIKRIEGEF